MSYLAIVIFLICFHHSLSAQSPPGPSWSEWQLEGRTCLEGASNEVVKRFCLLGDAKVENSLCGMEPDNIWSNCLLMTTPETLGIVLGETVVDASKWPWQVFIELDNGANQCGGTLIKDGWVVTAAHCFDDGRDVTKLVLGTTKKSGTMWPAVISKVDRVCCHEEYNSATLENDICLVKATEKFDFPIDPAKLPDKESNIENGTICWITGWGYDENRDLPEDLQEAEVKIVDRQICKEWHSQQGVTVVNNTICAGHENGGADSCGGDSGGPMVCWQGDLFVLHGITSYGPTYCGAAKSPGIYTKVSDFLQWIEETISNPCRKYHWSPWKSECSVSCGRGIERRARTCMDKHDKDTARENCRGGSTAVSFCHLDSCLLHSWSAWKEGSCSVTCGDGDQTDERTCLEGKNKAVSPENCGGLPLRTAKCNLSKCQDPEQKYQWGPWKDATCTVTCGEGFEFQGRDCLTGNGETASPQNCDGPISRVVDCVLPPCAVYSWGSWANGTCSATCGDGTRISTRRCYFSGNRAAPYERCEGSSRQSVKCNLGDCKIYKWGPWKGGKSCSVTCGIGSEIQIRDCFTDDRKMVERTKCGDSNVRIGECKLASCEEIVGKFCLEFKSIDTTRVVDDPRWFDNFAKGMTGDLQKILKNFNGFMGAEFGVQAQGLPNGKVQATVRVTVLVDTSRARGVTAENLIAHYIQSSAQKVRFSRAPTECASDGPCLARPCKNGGKCEKKFGVESGYSCLCRFGYSGQNCESDISEFHWGQWEGICSVTCGRGIERRNRRCLDSLNNAVISNHCKGHTQELISCNPGACTRYRWNTWQSGSCSRTCGHGSRTDTRLCVDEQNIAVPVGNCKGLPQRSVPCTLPKCPESHWGPWTRYCSRTCGEGQETRLRNCLDQNGNAVSTTRCDGSSVERGICNERECPRDSNLYRWGPWSTWSSCRRRENSANRCEGFHSANRSCLTGGNDIQPSICVTILGGDSYKEKSCILPGC